MTAFFGTVILAQEGVLPTAPTVANGGQSPAGTVPVTGQPAGPAGPGGPSASPFGGGFMFFALGLMALMIFMSMMASRKEKKRMATLLSSIKRHDRVMLAGGMIGTIAEVRDDEVVVKVDDATNTRIHFRKSSVQQVLRSASGDGSASESSAA